MVFATVEDTINQDKCLSNKKSYSLNATEKENCYYINYGKDDQMEIQGYQKCKFRVVLTWLSYVLSLGLLRLVYHWYPQMLLFSTHKQCSLDKADKVLIQENYAGKYKTYFVKDVKHVKVQNESASDAGEKNIKMRIMLDDGIYKEIEELKMFWCKKLCYVWDPDTMKFSKLIGLDTNIPNSELHKFQGYSKEEQSIQRMAYGHNVINVPVQTIPTLLCLEILNPFYIFQMCSIVLWLFEGYYYYNLAIVIMSVFGISTSIIQTRKNQLNLKGTVHSVDKITVCRSQNSNNNKLVTEDIKTNELVPGDIIIIPSQGCILECDCVLLEGGTCIVNESMLTGESMPVTKTPLPNTSKKVYDAKIDANHTLYCGTKVIQTRHYDSEPVKALVIRTGYLTSKGQLVRSILYPPPVDFKFDQDSYKFIGILAAIAFCGFVYTIIYKSTRGMTFTDITIKALDLITICVPPALPAAMTVGKIYALNRLKKKQIYCMNSRVINVSGSINCVCFDKTGTLTEDGLDIKAVIPVQTHISVSGGSQSVLDNPITTPSIDLSARNKMLLGMVTCHSIAYVNNEICGDPLDIKMFEATKWTMEDKHDPNMNEKYGGKVQAVFKSSEHTYEIAVVHQYQFSSNLQRMSVIAKKTEDHNFILFCKGSPEKIISLSKPSSVPENILKILKTYTKQGYRVIALASKNLHNLNFNDIYTLERDELENNLEFAGILIMENRLKPQTTGVIDILKRANMKLIMITGDNIETAISVAKECGIIENNNRIIDITINTSEKDDNHIVYNYNDDSFNLNISKTNSNSDIECATKSNIKYVMSGHVWGELRENFPNMIPEIVQDGVVFARMSSEQKQQLILELQQLGYYVAMCGDGANDCGALKAAHAGISLADTESSVASPFTSKESNISCVPKVIREGRAALVTSFGIFKFMVAYSLTEFTSCIILYTLDTNLTDLEFLFIDVALIVNFAFFYGKTNSYQGPLHNNPPPTSLLSIVPLLSLFLQMLSYVFFQVLSLYLIMSYSWYRPFVFNPDHITYSCYENYAVFAVSLFQYIIMAVSFSFGKPYRKPIYTNYLFMFSIILMTIINAYIVLKPDDWVASALELYLPPTEFRTIILVLGFANFCVSFIFEDLIVNLLVQNLIIRYKNQLKDKKQTEKSFLKGIDNVTFVDENGCNRNCSNNL